MIVAEKFHRRGPNVVLYVDDKFLVLPVSEVELRRSSVLVDQENLDAAYDVTPDLPTGVLENAWRFEIVFWKDVPDKWARDLGRVIPGLSAKYIVEAFMMVKNNERE